MRSSTVRRMNLCVVCLGIAVGVGISSAAHTQEDDAAALDKGPGPTLLTTHSARAIGPEGPNREAKFRATGVALYLTVRFRKSGLVVVCARADGSGQRTFQGKIELRSGPAPTYVGVARYSGQDGNGDVDYAFDVNGTWVNTIWRPDGYRPQFTRWLRVQDANRAGSADRTSGSAEIREDKR